MSKLYLLKTDIDFNNSPDRLPPIQELIKKVSTKFSKPLHQFCIFEADIAIKELNNLLQIHFSPSSKYILIEITSVNDIKGNLSRIALKEIKKMTESSFYYPKSLRPLNKQIPIPKYIEEMLHYQYVLATEIFESEEYELDKRKIEFIHLWLDYYLKTKELFSVR